MRRIEDVGVSLNIVPGTECEWKYKEVDEEGRRERRGIYMYLH